MMTPRQEGLLLIAALLVLSFIFQIQMKLLAGELAPLIQKSHQEVFPKVNDVLWALLSWRPLIVAALAIALFVVWLLALMRLELSLALPLASVALIVNSIGSGLLLGENLSLARMAGVGFVAAGIALVLNSG